MASCNNSIKINSDVNTVNIQPDNNKITVVNPDDCAVNITQPVTNVIQVATPGITGPAGPSGSVGPSGSAGSFDSGSFVTTSSFNAFTSSIQTEVDNLTSQTGSYVLNSQTGSFAITGSNNFIGNQVITGSLTISGSSTFTNIGPAIFSGSVNITQGVSGSFSGSFQGDGSGLTGVGTDVSGLVTTSSFNSFTSSINTFTSSIQSEIDSLTSATSSYVLNSQTGSFTTTSSFNSFTSSINSFTSSIQSEVDSLTLQTGSYATTGSNNFAGNQVITGSLTVSGSSTFTNIGPAVFSGSSTFTNITASGNISSSATITANAFVGGGSGITGVVSASYALTASHALNSGGGGGISAVVDDTSPQLGGDLDINSHDITGTGNISINTTSTSTPSLLLTSTNDTSDASPIIELKRNSSTTSNGDYLGQIKFKGENDADQEVVYAKITGKISDDTDTTEDGLIEFATKKAGSNVINVRLTSTDLKLINGTGLEVDNDISASGDISAITGSFSRIIGTVANTIFTLDFTSGQLSTRLFAPYNLSIDSVTNVTGSPTTNITSSGSPYTLGNAITVGTAIDVTASVSSVINLNITR